MKKHSLVKVLLSLLLIVVVATYLIAGRQGISRLALGDVVINFLQSFYYFFDTIVFILVVGAFYGLLENVKAYKKLQENLVSKIKRKKLAISIIIALFVLLSALTGLNMILLIFIPFAISLILMLGYDKIVALLSTVGAIAVGLIGGIFTTFRDPNSYYEVSYSTFDKFVGLDGNFSAFIPRIIIIVSCSALLILYVNKYIKKIGTKEEKITTNKEEKKETIVKVEAKETKVEKKEKEVKEVKEETKKVDSKPSQKNNGKTTKKTTATNKKKAKGKTKTNLAAAKADDTLVIKKERKTKTWPLIVIFALMLVILVLGYMPWKSLFEIEVFNNFHDWLTAFNFADLHKPILVLLVLCLLLTVIIFKNRVLKDKKLSKIIASIVLMLVELFIIFVFVLYTFEITSFGFAKSIAESTIWDSSIFTTLISQNITAFGTWLGLGNYLMASIIVVIFSLIIKCVYKVKFSDMLEHSKDGIKKLLPAAIMVMLAYTVLICAYNSGFMETIITKATDRFNDNIMIHSLISILGSILNVDMYYTVHGIFVPIISVLPETANLQVFSIAFQSLFGLVQLLGPTSLLLVILLTKEEVSYKEWLKNIWRLALQLFIVIFVIMLIMVMM